MVITMPSYARADKRAWVDNLVFDATGYHYSTNKLTPDIIGRIIERFPMEEPDDCGFKVSTMKHKVY